MVLVIGHAAAAGEAPANTLAGVRACLDAAADAMEIDVQLAADGVPVLMHDLTVDRTTNLRGPIRSFTAAQLAAADAGRGEPVPTLDSVLDLVAGRFTVMCELKADPARPSPDQELVENVLAVVRARQAESWTAIHSFDPEIVALARSLEPRVSGAIISPPLDRQGVDRLLGGLLERNGQAISMEHHYVDPDLVLRAKRRQVTVWAWTADSERDWARLVAAGADGIITNLPHGLRGFLAPR
jgi:glycerophosphoryl diester phosphodiesterase